MKTNACHKGIKSKSENSLVIAMRKALLPCFFAAGTSFAVIPDLALAQQETSGKDSNNNEEKNNQPAVLEEVVVKGFRRSLENAIDLKRDATAVIESISAEDIGKLPDISVAESIARLPGVSAQRTGGQAGAINIRGLDQGLVLSTLNGREQVATSGGRAIDFSQYPSELIAGVDVYKSTEARLIEGGLGGTVALKLARPLDTLRDDDHVFNINARASHNDRASDSVDSDENGSRLSFTYQGRFADDTVGLVFGYARLEQANVNSRFGSDTFTQTGNDSDGNGINNFIPFRYSAEELGGEDQRDGIITSLQWQPSDNFELAFDAYYSNFESTGFARGVTLVGPQSIGDGTDLINPVISNDVIIGGTFVRNASSPITDPNNPFTTGACCGGFGITPSSDTQTRDFDNELFSTGLNLKWTSGQWTFTGDISYSDSEAFQPDARIILHQVVNGFQLNPDASFNYLQDGLDVPSTFTFSENFGNDPSLVHVGGYQAFPTTNEDELTAFAGDVEYAFNDSPFTSVQFGSRYSERTASQDRRGFSLGNDAGFYQFAQNNDGIRANPFVDESIPGFSPVFVGPELYDVEQFNGAFSGFPNYLAIDFDAVASLFPNVTPSQLPGRDAITGDSQDFLLTETFTVDEDILAAYTQINFDTFIGDRAFRGNFGFRYVDTDVSSTSTTILNGQPVPITIDNDYSEILPSFNGVLELTEKDYLRVGIASVISRADLDDLRAGNTVNVDSNTGIVSGNGGNTNLDPFEADQIDLSYEHYSDSGGIYAVALFYKDLKTFIVSQTQSLNFIDEGFLDPNQVSLNPGVNLDPVGDFTAPTNGTGGNVRGIELAFTQTFDSLPAPFNGLGISANYSYTSSSITLPDTQSGRQGETITLPGLSRNVLNATIFYAYEGFETRLGYRFRDEFISRQRGIGEQLPITDSEEVLDYQASYEFGENSALSGTTVLFQVNNITDEPVTTYFNSPEQLSSLGFFGRQYFLGLSYSF